MVKRELRAFESRQWEGDERREGLNTCKLGGARGAEPHGKR